MIHPECFHPCVPDISWIRRASHARKTSPYGTPVARRQELPLLQREMRQLIEPDEQEFRALVLVNVILITAIAKARRRTVQPRHYVLRFVVTLVKLARHIAPEIRQQRTFQLRIRPPQQQRVAARDFIRLKDRFPQKPFGFSRARSPTEQSVFRGRFVKLALARKRSIAVPQIQCAVVASLRRGELFSPVSHRSLCSGQSLDWRSCG